MRACDAQFAKYKCPCLKNLTIAVSQLNRRDKDLLKVMNYGDHMLVARYGQMLPFVTRC